jgi:hypothetical protein
MQRLAQFSADKLGNLGTQANALGGRLMSQGFPETFRPIYENMRNAKGQYTAQQYLKFPTLTQHMSNVLPRTSAVVENIAGRIPAPTGPALIGGTLGAAAARDVPTFLSDFLGLKGPSEETLAEDARREALINLIPTGGYPPAPPAPGKPVVRPAQAPPPEKPPVRLDLSFGFPAGEAKPAAAAPSTEPSADDPLGVFIEKALKDQAAREVKPKSKIDRIKEAQAEYGPMFKELLGDTSEDMRMNAYLMLADAGLRLASSPNRPGSTPVSQVAEAFAPMAKGFMGLVAQAKDRQLKVDMGALDRAITDIDSQDKIAAQINLENLRGENRVKEALIKQMSKGNLVRTLGPMGLTMLKDKDGNEYEPLINANNPEFSSMVTSPNTLRQTDNPFVTDAGPITQALVVKDPKRRGELAETLSHFDNALAQMDVLQKNIGKAYGPKAFVVDATNKYVTPWLPMDLVGNERQKAIEEARQSQETLGKSLAMADRTGRLAVQQEKWAREAFFEDPGRFFSDPQIAATRLNQARAGLLNARQGVVEQLGGATTRLLARPMPLGTDSDPFVIPADPQGQQAMFTFLGGSYARTMDPSGRITIRLPDQLDDQGRLLKRGGLQYRTPTELMSIVK